MNGSNQGMIRGLMSPPSGLSRLPVRFSLALAFALVGLAMLPRILWAAGDEDAALRHGLDLRRQGKDQEALEEFQKAYAQSKSTRALAQIGLAEQALGRWVDAEAHLGQALSDETQPWIRKNSAVLKGAFEEIQRHIGSLEIIGPQAAEVRVNGQIVGTLPFSKPARVPIGTLNVELRKEGYLPSTRTVSITGGLLTRESISLQVVETPQRRVEAVPPRALEVTPTSPPPPVSGGGVDGDVGRAPTIVNSAGGTWQRPVAWGAAAAAALGVVGGGVALLLRGDRINQAGNLHCNVTNGTVKPVDPANGAQCVSLADSASSMGVAAVVMFSVAGALAIGSGVLFATMPSKASAAGSLACAPALATPGAVCQLRF